MSRQFWKHSEILQISVPLQKRRVQKSWEETEMIFHESKIPALKANRWWRRQKMNNLKLCRLKSFKSLRWVRHSLTGVSIYFISNVSIEKKKTRSNLKVKEPARILIKAETYFLLSISIAATNFLIQSLNLKSHLKKVVIKILVRWKF